MGSKTTRNFQRYYTVKDILRHITRGVFEYQMATGKFPRPIKTSVGKMRWKKETVDRWLEAYMEGRKRWKNIDPSIRIFRDYAFFGDTQGREEEVTVFLPPKGLVLECGGIAAHCYSFRKSEFDLIETMTLRQCPDYSMCKMCKDWDSDFNGWLGTCEEIER